MHSGTANAGHYWSYINLFRGLHEKNPDDPNWSDPSKDPWKEFNDSNVTAWNYKDKIKEAHTTAGALAHMVNLPTCCFMRERRKSLLL